jgi:hypothetical protein
LRRAALAFSIACAGALVAAATAHACSCIAISPETRFDQSDAAVIVRLVEVAPQSEQVALFRYRVKTVFKGERRIRVGQLLSLHASTSSAACGLPRQDGRRYGLFLRRANRHWDATLCDVTTPGGMRDAAAAAESSRIRTTCPG